MKTNSTMLATKERKEHKRGIVTLRSLRTFAAMVFSFLIAGTAAHEQVNSGSIGSESAINPTANVVVNTPAMWPGQNTYLQAEIEI